MRRFFLLLIIGCLTFSCDKYPDPVTISLTDYAFNYLTSSGMKFHAGEIVGDSVRFSVTNNLSALNDSFRVSFEILKGDGNISVQNITTKNRIASTVWRLGYGSCEQVLRARTYDLTGKYLTSTDLAEYGFRTDQWDEVNIFPDGYISGMATDTINKVTFMISNNQLFKQDESYFIWNQVTDPAITSPASIKIDNGGVFYLAMYNGGLLKSEDHGISWKSCTSPYPDINYNISVSISNDNYIWVYAWGKNTRFSKDGGSTWNTAGDELSLHGNGDFFRLKDGSLLFNSSGCCSLFRSFDEGQTWTKIETPGTSLKVFVNEKDEIFLCSQQADFSIYKSSDYGITFNKVFSINAYVNDNTMNNTFTRWGNFYYVLIPNRGILKSTDLINYEEYWFNPNLRDLFIDHNGDLIGKDKNMNTVYYRKSSI